MKKSLAFLLIAAMPVVALAQAATAATPAAGVQPAPKKSKLAPGAQKAVEEATRIDADPSIQLSEGDLAVARSVHVGTIPCELGAAVTVTAAKREGFFVVSTKNHRFSMHPVESRTGAIRLEDPKRGAMWLQLGNKSMLMSQKLGQRLADECMSPQQTSYADTLKKSPLPSILDAPPAPANAVPVTAPGAPAQ